MHRIVTAPYLLDNTRVTGWYYRDAPEVGAVVMYADETYIDVVDRVTMTHVWLASGRALRRPYVARRLVIWSITTWKHRRHRTTARTFNMRDWSASTA